MGLFYYFFGIMLVQLSGVIISNDYKIIGIIVAVVGAIFLTLWKEHK